MSATGEQYVVDEHGNRVAVILPLQEYEQLQEDLHDLAVVAERRNEPTVGSENSGSDTSSNGGGVRDSRKGECRERYRSIAA
ncbi:type II toxin-antitoxin system Phd/YefM family antitoxin [Methanoculleus chikugoensis]|uniref:type II toxin-antitoxin system prevent-host-death family antitoxin n=1 Tax=Methanoculleus chikugoensis TaxID=118126 RepID=UPI001FB55512|nr:type II toxin-antitoxin system prevent-host-death family antitoxin [Methanoculleus chikugoensis]